jgi:hypothetical protein
MGAAVHARDQKDVLAVDSKPAPLKGKGCGTRQDVRIEERFLTAFGMTIFLLGGWAEAVGAAIKGTCLKKTLNPHP